jgi:hypothetical protein
MCVLQTAYILVYNQMLHVSTLKHLPVGFVLKYNLCTMDTHIGFHKCNTEVKVKVK